jgi:acid stress-induced BolA-like protein IbaG/YrbA
MLPTPEQVKQYIAGGLACDHLEVEGDGQHFFATIVSRSSKASADPAAPARVCGAGRSHARKSTRSMKTLTPAEWQNA